MSRRRQSKQGRRDWVRYWTAPRLYVSSAHPLDVIAAILSTEFDRSLIVLPPGWSMDWIDPN